MFNPAPVAWVTEEGPDEGDPHTRRAAAQRGGDLVHLYLSIYLSVCLSVYLSVYLIAIQRGGDLVQEAAGEAQRDHGLG